ncbi:hypothetical protein COCC4DRAFT_62944 [Bipolaris maydis ATCC 48331]|uniref:Uncharacterized protein n=2 Tax=Cochliobolus heterostrophus TaxID=5016 RepID=M2TJT5_COCH5|nr:uncharacterized protein COCC4DRAFT_62944 [Bipolaris maydis ATCC 48331]EMD86744.1 hypothetical protein COCHEDRAFT_1034510 [Bipolaris maydis C5]KAJ6203681.1 hypothetical protein PSV09DRAFT_1034510 [Bipolaris maydis]ENI03136.1 hypothetical protein COCC4DRAFT_62944 [Bipolaris maydis ATCC 48331]KAJ6267346.1 hypothetical protein PSV08DRAFT_186633 [Bipolaris maydis]KAJ6267696.1 hypothetical protein PSV08DRAFT_186959 [Bipolaris maydis]
MSILSFEDCTQNVIDFETAKIRASITLADSGTFMHSQQSETLKRGGPVRHLENIQRHHILAREMPFYTRNGHDFSYHPLQQATWCLVLDPSTKTPYFESLAECQKRMISGKILYEDRDLGQGIHPRADREWISTLLWREEWSKDVYELKNVLRRKVNGKMQITVLLSPTDKARELLRKIRKKHEYMWDGLVRAPLNAFPPKWKNELLRSIDKRK